MEKKFFNISLNTSIEDIEELVNSHQNISQKSKESSVIGDHSIYMSVSEDDNLNNDDDLPPLDNINKNQSNKEKFNIDSQD